METELTIRQFWFGDHKGDAAAAADRTHLWWSKNPAVDREIQQRFEACVMQAAAHELDNWTQTPAGCLALILLTDQFPRNIYRDTPRAFAFDPLARAWCKEGLRNRMHESLRPIERVFFYLPLEHSESLDDQLHAVALFEELVTIVPQEQRNTFDGFVDYAHRHHEVIGRFGRFPHRNRILGRTSTEEELRFLEQKGSSF